MSIITGFLDGGGGGGVVASLLSPKALGVVGSADVLPLFNFISFS